MEPPIQVKQEPVEALNLENRILELCQQFPKGITDKVLQSDQPHVDTKQRLHAFQRLLSQSKLDLLKQKDNTLLYKLKDPESAKKVQGADNEEKLIYQIIQEAGNKGIWIRDIRFKSNLVLTQVNKILKNLESKKLIKAVKSVAASKKKVYMLYNLEPDQSLTGGAWYSDQDFESEFVEILNQQCFSFLQQKAEMARKTNADPISQKNMMFTSSKEIWKFISELGISKVQLTESDIETILNTLIFDGKVERTVMAGQARAGGEPEQVKLYRAVKPVLPPTGLMRMPCGLCPLINQCTEGGLISPSTCQYMKDWLEY